MTQVARLSVLEPECTPARERIESDHPYHAAVKTGVAGYAVLVVALLGVGLLLTHALSNSVGRWDEHVNSYLASHRSTSWNDVTKYATAAFNTFPVVLAAAVVMGLLAVRRRWYQAAFLLLALFLEITVFLSVTFIVARPRPSVARLNSTPSTSSFPSGHTAAATVLFVGIAVIVISCTPNLVARVSSIVFAALVPVTVAFARVYRGLHHPTDVFFGALLGLSCLLVSAMAVRSVSRARRPSSVTSRGDDADGVVTNVLINSIPVAAGNR
jgi:membrane-associated phospholipid phosphatase